LVRREKRLLRVDSAQRMGDCAGDAEAGSALEAEPFAAVGGCSCETDRLNAAAFDGVIDGAGRDIWAAGCAMGAALSGGGKYGMVGCCR
jgi:hypothetical protein